MKLLTVSAPLDRFHHDVFRCHERQLFHDPLFNNLFINHKSACDIDVYFKHSVKRKESFRNGNALVCAVVKCAFKPLNLACERRVECVNGDISCKRADAFAAHGIALIRHCGRAYLIFSERLLHLLKRLKNTQVVCKFICALCKT